MTKVSTEYRAAAARPVEEALLWADHTNGTQPIRMDETTTQNFGSNFVAWWWSPAVWHDPEGRLAEFNALYIKYVGEATSSFECASSGDGGVTWFAGAPSPVPVVAHHEGVQTVVVDFDFVQGHHLLFRICFTQPEITIVKGFIAEFIVRGSVRYRELTYAP